MTRVRVAPRSIRDNAAAGYAGVTHARAAAVVCFALAIAVAVQATAEDTVAKTEDVLSSVAGIARNLKLAEVPSPIDITADRLEFDYTKGLMRYTGSVRVEHAGATIRAQQIEVAFEPEGKRTLSRISARGGVEVVRGNETAHGELAEYDPKAATVTLSQNARLGSGPNSLSGERVVVYLRERRAVVQGGPEGAVAGSPRPDDGAGAGGAAPPGRVRVVIMPDSVKPGAPDAGKPAPRTNAGHEEDRNK